MIDDRIPDQSTLGIYMRFYGTDRVLNIFASSFLPMWDESQGMDSFYQSYNTLFCTGWAARELLGYPGRPDYAACPGDGA